MIMQILILIVSLMLGTPTHHTHTNDLTKHWRTETWTVDYHPYGEKNTDCELIVGRTKKIGKQYPWKRPMVSAICATNSGE